ncbi:Branched-chain amino acid transport ATP-binding protein LivF (TC 3.A.1.4.1) [Olavius sp. associated proteobacterium Delta 1]|nr:Branched-chain amino acid transport ATP-binding protein LivF (TC 3.A.1.4.1) [Olavius sp. associated proteobacterium Delta 1]
MILEVNEIYSAYGLSQILFGISLNVAEGEIVCLLGRNGVGKTTTLRSIMGLTPPHAGSIRWKGEEIAGKPSHRIARMGIGFVWEDRRIFSDLTVWENLDVAIKSEGTKKNGWTIERVFELFPALEPLRNRRGGFLSGGEQQMLTIARVLMGNPQLLLLDEPSEGLAPVVIKHLGQQISILKDEGMTLLISEQNTKFALDLSDRLYILEKGEVRYEGSVDEFQKDEAAYKAYLTL